MIKLYDHKLNTTPIQITHFPAGETHVTNINENIPSIAWINSASADDLIALAMVANAAAQQDTPLTAFMPYLPGARADRGTPFGAQVYANIINTMNLKNVIAFDVHSPVITGLINNIIEIDSVTVITEYVKRQELQYDGIISPDKGAVARAQKVATALNLPLIKAEKIRDFTTGKLTDFTCEPVNPTGTYLVVDDICDGGGTFMGLATATNLPKEQLHLWISHGIFSGRAAQLTQAYDKIITTNSFETHNNVEIKPIIVDLLPYLHQEYNKINTKNTTMKQKMLYTM